MKNVFNNLQRRVGKIGSFCFAEGLACAVGAKQNVPMCGG
jgi:hypothetical protein